MTPLSPAAVIRETPAKSFVHVDRLPGSSTAARRAASRAVKDGLLLPVRRGLYCQSRHTRYGVVAPRPEAVARAALYEKEIALLELLRSAEVYVEAGWDALVARLNETLAVAA
ncbi:MAG: hypothetical protein ACRCYU_05480 [Nocardioides sp.]